VRAPATRTSCVLEVRRPFHFPRTRALFSHADPAVLLRSFSELTPVSGGMPDGGLTLGDFVTKSDKGKKPRTAQASSQPASSSGTVSAPGNNVAAAPPAGGGSGTATTPEDDEAALEALLFPQFE